MVHFADFDRDGLTTISPPAFKLNTNNVIAVIRAHDCITFLGVSDKPETWPNSLLIQFESYEDYAQAKVNGKCSIVFDPSKPFSEHVDLIESTIPIGTYRGFILPIDQTKKRFWGSKRTRYANALVISFENQTEMARAVTTGRVILHDGTFTEAENEEHAAWCCEHTRRLAEEPAYFAFVAMQSSGTKHSNQKSPSRDFYYFGPILYSAMSNQRDLLRLLAMAELTRECRTPFADDRSNCLLVALCLINESDNQIPTFESVIDALDKLGLLEAAGGRTFLEQKFSQIKTST